MDLKKINKKWYSNIKYYNSDIIRNVKAEDGHSVDIAFVYSGRNRGKSFEISTKALLDAWTSQGEIRFGYARRYDKEMKNYAVEEYFDDKIDFIKDISDNQADGIVCFNGALYFSKNVEKNGKVLKERLFQIGNVFCLSLANQYKSRQYPKITRLIYEEVFTRDGYVPEEPRKMLDLVSTIQRSRKDFIAYLISNTVSRVNPYVDDYGLTSMIKQKAGTIDRYKLYKGTYDEQGNEEYYFICCEYLEDAAEEIADNKIFKPKNKMGTSVLTNKWDEPRLYPVASQKEIDKFQCDYNAVFENGAFKFYAKLLNVPVNYQAFLDAKLYDQELPELSDEVMPVVFITRKTTPYQFNTRLYTTEPIVYPLVSRGLINLCDFDNTLMKLIEIGHCYYANNLIACEFVQCYKSLKQTRGI